MPPPLGSSGTAGPSPGRSARDAPAPEAPPVAFFAAFLGGVLIAVEGFVLLGGGPEPLGLAVASLGLGSAQLGGIGVALGIGVVAVGFQLNENPGQRRGIGAALVGLGTLSVVAGGGFGGGLGLVVAGGLIAILVQPAPVPSPGD